MSRRGAVAWMEWGAIILIVIGAAILAVQLNSYSNFREQFPDGLTIAGVDVGSRTAEEAAQRVSAVYSSEVDLYYQGERIPLDPVDVEFVRRPEADHRMGRRGECRGAAQDPAARAGIVDDADHRVVQQGAAVIEQQRDPYAGSRRAAAAVDHVADAGLKDLALAQGRVAIDVTIGSLHRCR